MSNPYLLGDSRAKETTHAMTFVGHICTRFNAPHLSTPTENHVLHRCRWPHPPPRRPRAPRRLREVLQGAHSIPFIHHPLRSACFSSSPKWSRESRGVGVRTRAPMPRAASVRAYTRREARRRESKLAFRDATRFVFRRATRHRRVPADRIATAVLGSQPCEPTNR